MNIYLLQYNNYSNRIIKGFETLDEYRPYIISSSLNVNKSVKNSINNTFTYNDIDDALNVLNRPNYCLITDNSGNNLTRWFVISCEHKGSGSNGHDQYEITLRRDLIYDFHEDIEKSEVLCKRGYSTIGSPQFLNIDDDTFPFNKIKYKEVMLKEDRSSIDGVDAPWLYLYRSKSNNELNLKGNYDFGNMEDNVVNDRIEEDIYDYKEFEIPFTTRQYITGGVNAFLLDVGSSQSLSLQGIYLQEVVNASGVVTPVVEDESKVAYDDLMSRSGTTVSIAKSRGEGIDSNVNVSRLSSQSLINFMNSYPNAIFRYFPLLIDLTLVSGSITMISIGLESNHTDDSVFDIYCLPYNKDNLSLMSNLALDGATYDLQVLPYGPSYGLKTVRETISIGFIVGSNSFYKSLGVCKASKRQFNIITPSNFDYNDVGELEPYNYGLNDYETNKIGLNAYEVRLVSPDSQAIEVLNTTANYKEGQTRLIGGFNVYVMLKPYSPYIQVKPVYRGFNGYSNFDDYRGLICGSGFSLAIANDQWREYQLNNKNYQQQFDRDVNTMKLNTGLNVVSGITKSAGQGVAGFAMGGVAGAAIGAGAGLVDTATGVASSIYNIGTAKKEFKWNIENIQNRAKTLKSIDAQNPNFKFYPYLEVFKGSDEEIRRFKDYLKKHGSHIGTEGLFIDFINGEYPYVECILDEYFGNNLTADMLEQITAELNEGIYYEV